MQLSNETDTFQRRQKSWSEEKINQTKPPKGKILTALFQLIKMNDEQQAIRGSLNWTQDNLKTNNFTFWVWFVFHFNS